MTPPTEYGPVTEPTVVFSTAKNLYILKSPKKGGGEQIIFAAPNEALMFQRLLSEKLGVQVEVKQEIVTDNDNELINLWQSVNLNKASIEALEREWSAMKTLFGTGGR